MGWWSLFLQAWSTENICRYAESPFLCGGIIRTRALEHLKVSFLKSSQTARTFLLIGDGKEWIYCCDGFLVTFNVVICDEFKA